MTHGRAGEGVGVGEGGGCQGSWGLRGSDAPEDDDTGTHAADEPARRCQSDVFVQWAQLLRSLRWWWSGGARRFQAWRWHPGPMPSEPLPLMALSPPSSCSIDGGEALGGEGDAETVVIVGTASTVISSAIEASAAVPRVEESEVCTAAAVVEAGTAMVAVMSTLPAVMAILTSDLSTPAAVAKPCCKREVSE